MLFVHSHKTHIFSFLVFLFYNDVYFEHTERYKNDNNQRPQRHYMFENYCKRIKFTKENSYYSMKHQKKKDFLLLATKLIE